MNANPQAAHFDPARQFLPDDVARLAPEELCRKLARTHYENFTVGSFLLPKSLRRHVYNIYAYCRVCDDLADETGDPKMSLRLLEWWREELAVCYQGRPRHPIFRALAETIEQFDIPSKPFVDLISAFEQDQRVTRYASFEELLGYCERSANPVGRLFLHLLGYRDEARQRLADFTCTALQLANFWQDIPTDYAKGRVYLPQEDLERFGYTEAELRNGIRNPAFVQLMRFEIARTRELFERGAPLARLVSDTGAADVALFTAGGMSLPDAIEKRGFDVFHGRVKVSSWTKLALIARAIEGRWRR